MGLRFLRRFLALTLALATASISLGEEVSININADRVLHPISRHLTGVCIEDVNHEIYGGIYSQMIFGESFQEPSPSPAIKDFKAYDGKWVIRDGTLHVEGADGPKLVSDHAAFKDGAVGVQLFFSERKGQNAGLVLRINKPGVGADAFIGYEVALYPENQTLILARHRNNFEPIKTVPCEVAVGRWIPLEVHLDGSVIEISVDGKMILRHDDAGDALPAGGVALRVWHREAGFRNLWVTAGDKSDPLPFSQATSPQEVSGMWRPVVKGTAQGHCALVREKPFVGTQSQQITFESGDGEIGIENRGLNRWGLNFVAGKDYDGRVWVRAEKPTTLVAAMESGDGSKTYAEQSLSVAAGDWQRLAFTLTPSASDNAGRFTLKLKQPGSVTIGYALLQPGDWGRFKGLPVRRDVAEGMINQGVTIVRYGGSMVNNDGYRWKNMIGPRDQRPPYAGLWYRYSSNGWGIPDFMAFCEAAGFEYVPAFNMGESPKDMADFIDYAKAAPESEWGQKRSADGHPAPFQLHYMELGNEERVDEKYAEKFESLAAAIWVKDPKMILVVGDFAYGQTISDPFHFAGAASGLTTLAGQQRILRFAKAHDGEVWFDIHIDTDHPVPVNNSLKGMLSYSDALDKIADGARHKVVVFEFNSGNHAQKRALANMLAIHAIMRDGRTPIVCCANGLQPDKQNDNGWDQGLLFLNPVQVWLQPPGYAMQMASRNYQPNMVGCDIDGQSGSLDAIAMRSDDGKTLMVQVVNPGEQVVAAKIILNGFKAAKPQANVMELSGPMDAANTAEKTDAIVPKESTWTHDRQDEKNVHTFSPHSFTVLRFE